MMLTGVYTIQYQNILFSTSKLPLNMGTKKRDDNKIAQI